ncbi:hypothetical protein AWB69_08893 [Caballeronia udeis]|uniref:Uncharacterized protein n=1 Tax=Caballeronia udeis TaxID=1232866 RepID=A0A158JVW9_9BURK|nr:hypothetical protein AWB69_08893 [Caballeronia udeis]
MRQSVVELLISKKEEKRRCRFIPIVVKPVARSPSCVLSLNATRPVLAPRVAPSRSACWPCLRWHLCRRRGVPNARSTNVRFIRISMEPDAAAGRAYSQAPNRRWFEWIRRWRLRAPGPIHGASATVRSGGQQSDAMVFNHSSPTRVINAQRIGKPIEHFEPPVDARTARTRGR